MTDHYCRYASTGGPCRCFTADPEPVSQDEFQQVIHNGYGDHERRNLIRATVTSAWMDATTVHLARLFAGHCSEGVSARDLERLPRRTWLPCPDCGVPSGVECVDTDKLQDGLHDARKRAYYEVATP